MTIAAAVILASVLPPVLMQPTLLLSEERLREESIFIGSIKTNHIHQALFPDINFVCSGNLTKWMIVASPVGGGLWYPEVHIWTRDGISDTFTRSKRNKFSRESPNPVSRVYEEIRNPPLWVEAGSVLGVYNPPTPALRLLYQKRGGPLNYYVSGPHEAYRSFNLGSGLVLEDRNDYPLVSVEVEPPECAYGFVDRDTLLRKASLLTVNSSDLEYREGTQRIIPDVMFSADGVILNVTMGALHQIGGSRFPEIQIWRSTDQREWFKVGTIGSTAAITYNIALNVHRYTPLSPLAVQAGDVLGFYQPHSLNSALRIFMQSDGPLNYYRGSLFSPLTRMTATGNTERRLPLIKVHFSTTRLSSDTLQPSRKAAGTQSTNLHVSRNTHSDLTASVSASSSIKISTTPNMELRGSAKGGIIAGGVVIAMLLVGVIGMGVALVLLRLHHANRRGEARRRRRTQCEHPYDKPVHFKASPNAAKATNAPPTTTSDQDMEYNILYPHTDPTTIIINGQRQAMDLKRNSAYSLDETVPVSHATNPMVHHYEDVDPIN